MTSITYIAAFKTREYLWHSPVFFTQGWVVFDLAYFENSVL